MTGPGKTHKTPQGNALLNRTSKNGQWTKAP